MEYLIVLKAADIYAGEENRILKTKKQIWKICSYIHMPNFVLDLGLLSMKLYWKSFDCNQFFVALK